MNKIEHYNYLPLYAKLTLERMDGDSSLRTVAMMDELLTAYAAQYRETVEDYVRESVAHHAFKRFDLARFAI